MRSAPAHGLVEAVGSRYGSGRMNPQLLARRLLLALALALSVTACRRKAPLPELGQVPRFEFKDQDGARVSSDSLRGKVWAVAFMFTRCPTICPRVTRFMLKAQERAAARQVPLRLVSISVDPENDTPQVLKEYAQRFGVSLASWSFLTGEFEAIQRTSVDGFKLALDGRADPRAPDYGIVHGSHLVLVDRALHIRGYYRTDDEREIARLLDDSAQLAEGEK